MTDVGTIVHCRDLRNAMSHSDFAGDLRAALSLRGESEASEPGISRFPDVQLHI